MVIEDVESFETWAKTPFASEKLRAAASDAFVAGTTRLVICKRLIKGRSCIVFVRK